MRVLLLAPHPFFQQRGTPIAEKMLVEVLAAHGHEVEVLTFAEGDDPGLPGVRVHRLPRIPGTAGIRPGFSVKKLACDAVMLWKCLALARERRYDLLHAVEESAFMARAARLLFGTPYVYDMDSGLARQMVDKFPLLGHVRALLDGCEAWAVRGSAGTLAVCKSLEEQAREYHPGGLVARIEDVSLLGDSASDGAAEAAGDLPEGCAGRPLVMYVGNLQRYQGIDLLIEAFAVAHPEVPEARLVVIGGDDESIASYRRRCAELGIGEAAVFLGPRPVERLGAYLERATVLVSPRIHGDNTPMKVYSYLDSGRALLATRLPTHTQVLTDEIACLVEPTPDAMARGLVDLLRNEVLRERLAANAREMAQRELTPQAFERKLLHFYDQVSERIGEGWHDGNLDGKVGKSQRLEAGRPGAR
jgi:glycosyltransferase involved in cell wall biosynthesis